MEHKIMSKQNKDGRYISVLTFCGHKEPKWMTRFCGDLIGISDTESQVEDVIAQHKESRA